MSEDIYRKRECDLCGKFAFEKHLGTSKVLDGGFTRVEDFEDSGFGSVVVNFHCIGDDNGRRVELMVCPDCKSKISCVIYSAINEIEKLRRSDNNAE